LTPERQDELRRRIDQRFDQFSLDELRDAESGAMTFGSVFPELSLREREFAEQRFNRKTDELRTRLKADQDPAGPKGA
jgi:hypothetical protein